MKKITIAELDKTREIKKKDWSELQDEMEDKKEKGKIAEIIKSGKFPGFDHKMGGKG